MTHSAVAPALGHGLGSDWRRHGRAGGEEGARVVLDESEERVGDPGEERGEGRKDRAGLYRRETTGEHARRRSQLERAESITSGRSELRIRARLPAVLFVSLGTNVPVLRPSPHPCIRPLRGAPMTSLMTRPRLKHISLTGVPGRISQDANPAFKSNHL